MFRRNSNTTHTFKAAPRRLRRRLTSMKTTPELARQREKEEEMFRVILTLKVKRAKTQQLRENPISSQKDSSPRCLEGHERKQRQQH